MFGHLEGALIFLTFPNSGHDLRPCFRAFVQYTLKISFRGL